MLDDKGFEEMSHEEFLAEAEQQGTVYTLEGFAKAFNEEEVNTFTDVVKIV